jgi:hypothetical protein
MALKNPVLPDGVASFQGDGTAAGSKTVMTVPVCRGIVVNRVF